MGYRAVMPFPVPDTCRNCLPLIDPTVRVNPYPKGTARGIQMDGPAMSIVELSSDQIGVVASCLSSEPEDIGPCQEVEVLRVGNLNAVRAVEFQGRAELAGDPVGSLTSVPSLPFVEASLAASPEFSSNSHAPTSVSRSISAYVGRTNTRLMTQRHVTAIVFITRFPTDSLSRVLGAAGDGRAVLASR